MALRKIINDPGECVDEVLDGIVSAHPDAYRFASADKRAVVAPATPGRVGIVTGGGSGHLPLFLGYVGSGLATGVAVGNVFSSPSPAQIFAATRAADGGNGVLYLYGNYGGDVYNFDLAAEMASAHGIPTRTVLGADDVLSAPADRGYTLDEVTMIAQRASSAVRTAGMGLAPTILPAAGKPTFTLAEGEMEVGVGIHGESGIATVPIASADSIAGTLFEHLNAELGLTAGSRVAVLVNGLGATPLEELYLLYSAIARLATEQGAHIAYNFIGEYATSLEMAGASVSIMRLDSELEALLNAPAQSPFYRPGTAISQPRAASATVEQAAAVEASHPTADFESPLRSAFLALAERMPAHTDELRDLDAALGDGDLGLTVSAGVVAMADRIFELPDTITSSALMRDAAMSFASANPSTFAALVGSGMLAASTGIDDSRPLDRQAAVAIGRAIAAAIVAKGGAELGDKTLLDVLVPALDELDDGASAGHLRAFLDRRIGEIASWRSRRGRAAWHQERSIGLKDPGSVAVAYALVILIDNGPA